MLPTGRPSARRRRSLRRRQSRSRRHQSRRATHRMPRTHRRPGRSQMCTAHNSKERLASCEAPATAHQAAASRQSRASQGLACDLPRCRGGQHPPHPAATPRHPNHEPDASSHDPKVTCGTTMPPLWALSRRSLPTACEPETAPWLVVRQRGPSRHRRRARCPPTTRCQQHQRQLRHPLCPAPSKRPASGPPPHAAAAASPLPMCRPACRRRP
mmetsp:Transcript_15997/g.55861  ORF Transcript_15997/g.55861 Transcript_15997/m.55861 type:complete len:213 (-) Transcript_15997:764-1402(-)